MAHLNQVLLYSDSLSWGIVPGTRRRLPFDERWPGVLENGLIAAGERVRIIEDCLNGRRTVWEDPFKAGRNGLVGMAQRMEVNSPLALVILMLGTNDFQFSHSHNTAWAAAQGMATLVKAVREAPIEPGMPVPPILMVCPPPMQQAKGPIAWKFERAAERSFGLAEAYRAIAEELGCAFFDAGTVATTSSIDGVHLDVAEHEKLGEAMVPVVRKLLSR